MRGRVVVIGIVAVAGLACGGTTEAITDADRAVLVNADDFLDVATIDRTKEVWAKNRAFDGGVEVSYEYQAPAFMVHSSIHRDPDASAAGWTYTGSDVGMGIAAKTVNDVVFVDAPGLLAWGDEHHCQAMMVGAVNAGTMCVARKGVRTMVFMVAGRSFVAPGSVDAFLGDRLPALEAWDP